VIGTVVFLPSGGRRTDGDMTADQLNVSNDFTIIKRFSESSELEKMGANCLGGFLNQNGSRGGTRKLRILDVQLSSLLDSRIHFSDALELLYTPHLLLLRVHGQHVRSFLSDFSSKGGKTSRYR